MSMSLPARQHPFDAPLDGGTRSTIVESGLTVRHHTGLHSSHGKLDSSLEREVFKVSVVTGRGIGRGPFVVIGSGSVIGVVVGWVGAAQTKSRTSLHGR
jgi:hypothetical protein